MSLIILAATAPTLLLNPNDKRRKLSIQMQPVDVDANNVGTVRLSFGSQPSTAAGAPEQGLVLIGSAGIEEPSGISALDTKYKQAVWAVSSDASQSIVVSEELET